MGAHGIRWWHILLLWLGVIVLSGGMLDVLWGTGVSGAGGLAAVSLSGWQALLLLIVVIAALALTIVWLRGRRRHVE